jgi:hypothetical protein
MRPRRLSRRSRPPTMQLSLLRPAPCVVRLAPEERAGVIAALARLLLEAARPAHLREGADDAS